MNIVFIGLSITSSWGNGHATTYRALLKALGARQHDLLFLERDAPWYAANRDLPRPPYCRAQLYSDAADLAARYAETIRDADAVVVGSYVPEGIAIGDLVHRVSRGVKVFYDIDTPVTLARLERGVDYLTPRQIPKYDLYLSFTGGPTLDQLRRRFGARQPRPLYCSVDPELYYPEPEARAPRYDLGYLGTYSEDRQPVLDRLLTSVARSWPQGRFIVAGPQYPASVVWPAAVRRIIHLNPSSHRRFYNSLRFTLNVTRRDMVAAGFSPSVRLFEAAACATPIISDSWPGIDRFFSPGIEILLARRASHTLAFLQELPEDERQQIGLCARDRVLQRHTAAHRACEFESYLADLGVRPRPEPSRATALAGPSAAEAATT